MDHNIQTQGTNALYEAQLINCVIRAKKQEVNYISK
jgi:hypothetical protein